MDTIEQSGNLDKMLEGNPRWTIVSHPEKVVLLLVASILPEYELCIKNESSSTNVPE